MRKIPLYFIDFANYGKTATLFYVFVLLHFLKKNLDAYILMFMQLFKNFVIYLEKPILELSGK